MGQAVCIARASLERRRDTLGERLFAFLVTSLGALCDTGGGSLAG